MGRTRKAKASGRYLIVSHDQPGARVYTRRVDGAEDSLVIPPGVEVVAHDDWIESTPFALDVQRGVLSLRRSDMLPDAPNLDIDPQYEPMLDTLQINMARRIALDPLTPPLRDAMNVHKVLLAGGVTPYNGRVTKDYVLKTHRPMLMAARDLAGRAKRAERVEVISEALREIEAL